MVTADLGYGCLLEAAKWSAEKQNAINGLRTLKRAGRTAMVLARPAAVFPTCIWGRPLIHRGATDQY